MIRPFVSILIFSQLFLAFPSASVAKTADRGRNSADQPIYPNKEILFEENDSQAPAEVRLLARSRLYDLFLANSGAALKLKNSGIVTVSFVDSDPRCHLSGSGRSSAFVNYFRGSDPKYWHRNIRLYNEAAYSQLYHGIDLAFYGTEGNIEYDFRIAPRADPANIRLRFGAGKPVLTTEGDLVIALASGELRFRAPQIYQMSGAGRSKIQGKYLIDAFGTVTFALGAYDHSKPLVIDPIISYSTFLGGSDDEGIFGIRRDQHGNIYVSGETSSVDFPIKNPSQSTEGGDYDAFVSKFDPSGTHLIYSTYLGGNGYDHAVGLAINQQGEAFVAGVTQSTNFPAVHALQGILKGSSNAFITHLASSGSELIFSTYLGGGNSDGATDMAIDPASNVFIAGQTNSTDFPTTPGVLQTTCDGSNAMPGTCRGDGFVSKISADGSKLLYSTYLGGTAYDEVNGLAVDRDGEATVTGQTQSPDFPVLHPFQSTLPGIASAFIAKLNNAGSELKFSSYFGGSRLDSGNAIALGPEGAIWITGFTSSQDFPLVSAFQTEISQLNSHCFVSEFSPDGMHLLRSSFFGGTGFDDPFRIGVDAFGSPSIIGFTTSTDLPVLNAVQRSFGGGYSDTFVLKLLPKSFKPLYATYLGGVGDEFGYGIYQEPTGALWFGGSTSSQQFPVKGGFQSTYSGGPFDAYLTRFSLTVPDYLRIIKDILGYSPQTSLNAERNVERLSIDLSMEKPLAPQRLAERMAQTLSQP